MAVAQVPRQEGEEVRSGMTGLFCLLGFVAALGLSIESIYLSWVGLASYFTVPSPLATFTPPILAFLTAAVNANAYQFVTMLKEQKESQFSLFLLGATFVMATIYDFASNVAGFLVEVSGKTVVEAMHESGTDMFVGIVMGAICTIGPFLCGLFHALIVKHGGFMNCLIGVFVSKE